MAKELVKTDRNGTKYYREVVKCWKCSGTGHIGYYAHVFGGECFECNATGKLVEETKEYTPEYQAKLDAKRNAKIEKERLERIAKASEKNVEFLEKAGLNATGKCYVVLGNTYPIKDQLKEAGASFKPLLGWFFKNPVDGYETLEMTADELYCKNDCGEYMWGYHMDGIADKIKVANDKLTAKESTSEYVGTVGDRVEMELTLENSWDFSYSLNSWTTISSYLYKFRDANGNIITWKASSCQGFQNGTTVKIKGTIKEHSEYKGEKQTVLTRCKVTK